MADFARAAVMLEPGQDLAMIDYPLPHVKEGCILVRVDCCTICGSDLHSWAGRRPAPTPIILGHEIVGRIAELGPGAPVDSHGRLLKVGDRITWTLVDSCGHCYYCSDKELPMKCLSLRKYGHDSCADAPHFKGGFAEYCYLTPGTAIVRVPDELTNEEVSPANCALATAVAAWQSARLCSLENVLVQGVGALGLYAVALAKHAGCRRIIASDVDSSRLALAVSFGATDTIDASRLSEANLISHVHELSGGFGVDCVLEAAGNPQLIPLGLRCLRKGGRLVEVGSVVPGAHFTYDASELISRRLTLMGIHNYDNRHLQAAVDFLAATRQRFPFAKIVTHRVSLERIAEGLQVAHCGEAIRVAILPG